MSREALFKLEGIEKVYGSTKVLKNIHMEIKKGEIVGLIGENGAGKSTLLKIIMGLEQPTHGTMRMGGKPYRIHSILQAGEHGVGMVFQEQSLILNLTVAQNIFLGREKQYTRSGLIDWRRMNADAGQALKRLGIADSVAPTKVINELNFATRQLVEIAKVLDILSRSGKEDAMLLLDEPTTVLSDEEIRLLFREVRRLKEKGVSVVFISHRLEEVLGLTDRIYVLRDGENVGEIETAQATTDMLYEKMVGRATTGEYYFIKQQTAPSDEVVLKVRDLCRFGHFKNVTFDLHKSEVLALCGVEGSGKEEVCAALCGDEEYTYGQIEVCGQKVKALPSPAYALERSILAIPKERRDEGMAGMLSVKDNMALSSLKRVSQKGIVPTGTVERLARKWVQKMGVKCDGIDIRIDSLSGGNAQKVIFGRVMASEADILILNHPTRGVDVGAKEDIYKTIREITDAGKSIILLGDTLDECIGLASRIIVMKDGEVQKELSCPPDAKPEQVEIVRYMM